MGLRVPSVAVFGTAVQEEEERGGGEAVDQVAHEGLALRVDPVQVLEHEAERLDEALAQEQALDGLERPLAPMGGVQRFPAGIHRAGIQERQERGQRWAQRLVER